MIKLTEQNRMYIALAVMALIGVLAAASYNLFPFWTRNIIPRDSITVTAAPISTMNKPVRIERMASIGNSSSVPINSEYYGSVSEIFVQDGQQVKAGQPLLQLQGTGAESESSPAAPTDSQAGVDRQAQDNYDNALKEFNRYQKLYDQGAVPRRQFDNAFARLKEAEANLASEHSTGSTGKAATLNGFAVIKAPIDGIVTGLSTAPGKIVQAGQKLMGLGSGQEVEAIIKLSQDDLYSVHLGTTTAIQFSDQMILGQVSSIYPQVEANQISSYLAHTKLTNNPGGLLKPGMSVNVLIETGQSETVLAIPNDSILQDEQGGSYVYIAASGKAIRQSISIGETIHDLTEITSSLPQETVVITGSLSEINNGDAIAIAQ